MKSIREIAKLAGVSSATVSRYMNNSGYVAASTAEKIEEVLAANEYHPNKLTSAIFSGRTNDIALIVQNITNPFFAQLVDEIEDYIEKTKYNLIIYNCKGNRDVEAKYYKELLERRIAGILVINTNDELIYTNHAVPIIAVEKAILDNPKVSISNKQAINKIFEHVQISDTSTLMVKGANNYSSSLRERYFKKQASANNCTLDLIEIGDEMKQLQGQIPIDFKKFKVVFCWTDIVAHKIYSEIVSQGLKVPEDVQLIGFDGLSINSIFSYKLSTIDQNIRNIGNVAVNNLITLIGGGCVEDAFLDCQFIKGDTTK